jgi:lambda repressor-like predicted transcriptional regulator
LTQDELAMLVEEALKNATPTMRAIADRAGLSYGTLRSWSVRRRRPRKANLEQLAAAFDEQAEVLREYAHRLRTAAR